MTAVPQSLLEALEDECKQFIHTKCRREAGGVRFAITAVTKWFSSHDLVEVVRCGDCEWQSLCKKAYADAGVTSDPCRQDEFCSRGLRRTDEPSS